MDYETRHATLGFFIHKKLSLIALGIAMAYTVLDLIGIFMVRLEMGQVPPVGAILMRVVIFMFMIGAFRVIRQHKASLNDVAQAGS